MRALWGSSSTCVNPPTNRQKPLLAAGRGRIGVSLIPAAILAIFGAADRPPVLRSSVFDGATGDAGRRHLHSSLALSAWLLGWAAVDYLIEWQSRESRLKMSRQDMRDEYKETEGSPQVRSRIRSLQRQMRRRKVKDDVSPRRRHHHQPHQLCCRAFRLRSTPWKLRRSWPRAATCWPAGRSRPRALASSSLKPAAGAPALSLGRYRPIHSVDRRSLLRRHLAHLYRQRVEAEVRDRRAREAAARTAATRAQAFRGARPTNPPSQIRVQLREVRNEHHCCRTRAAVRRAVFVVRPAGRNCRCRLPPSAQFRRAGCLPSRLTCCWRALRWPRR